MPKPLQTAPSLPRLYLNALQKKTISGFNCQNPLPALSLILENQRINTKQLLRYNKVCGFSDEHNVPASFLQVLSFPLQMSLLTSNEMPIAAMGLVHLSNRIISLKAIDAKESISIQCSVGDQRLSSKGLDFDINATICDSQGNTVMKSTATLLYRCKTGIEKEKNNTSIEPFNANHHTWNLAANIGRRYGKLSADLNPIHLFALSAKLFGFKRQIAHGLFLNAKALATFEGELPQAPFEIRTAFKRPAFIPSSVNVYSQTNQHEKSIQIWSKDHKDLHLTANIFAIGK